MGRNIVPRTNKGADLGTSVKNWNNVYTDILTANSIILSGSDLQALLNGKTDLATLTAKGDIYVATDTGVLTRLPAGNDGEILKANSGTPEGLQWAPGGARSELTSNITVTVGSGGDFPSIKAALSDLVSLYYPIYLSNNNPKVTINLLSGFVMAEQITIEYLDLSWITITGDDAETTIARSAVPSAIWAPFHARQASTLPIIGQLFSMDTSGTANSQKGINVSNCSKAIILEGCGVKNATGIGLNVENSSMGVCEGSIFSGAGLYGILSINSSIVHATNVNVSGAGSIGINTRASLVNAAGCNASGAVRYGVVCGSAGLLNIHGGDCSGAGTTGIIVENGGIINADVATGTLSQTKNTITSEGIIFQS